MAVLYIFGTSGFARETRDIADLCGWDCVFVAASAEECERNSWIGNIIVEDDMNLIDRPHAAIGIGDNKIRQKIATRFADRVQFINLIHPSASFGSGQRERIDRQVGVIVCAGVRFTNSIEVGNFSIFNLNATIGHDAVIGDFVNIAPGANISGQVEIRPFCWIGTNAAINQGSESQSLCIGENTMIGSGSVVVKDCDADSTYVGIPARKR